MREADRQILNSQLFRPRFCGTVKPNMRFAASVRHNLHIAPANPVHSCSERFRDGLLCGESDGEVTYTTTAIGDFRWRVNSVEKSLTVPPENAFYPVDFDSIDAGC